MQIDFYVDVIDNFGDMGFAYHIAQRLVQKRPEVKIRFFSHDRELFDKISHNNFAGNIAYFDESEKKNLVSNTTIFNFFDKKLDEAYLKSFDFDIEIYNFTYFMMHEGCESLHNTSYKTGNLTIRHLVPSLLKNTFGVVIPEQKSEFSREEIMKKYNISEENIFKKWVGVFCYPETLQKLEKVFASSEDTLFFLFDERNRSTAKNVINMPFLEMQEYYDLMRVFDLNIVRGENTLVAGIVTKKPFLWDIYKEKNGQHTYKIEEFSGFLEKNFIGSSQYTKIFQGFNLGNVEANFQAFLDTNFGDVFMNIAEYVEQNCDMMEKIEKEVFKN